ncbi:hypothetical protein, partial [Escherichia coli]|uniref:hypothetical protein n=1 Tax=Escherichia coli TaxID=562 RepID=UPI002FBEC7EB
NHPPPPHNNPAHHTFPNHAALPICTNQYMLCLNVLNKTAFPPFFIFLKKFKKHDWFTWPERVPDLPVEFYTT